MVRRNKVPPGTGYRSLARLARSLLPRLRLAAGGHGPGQGELEQPAPEATTAGGATAVQQPGVHGGDGPSLASEAAARHAAGRRFGGRCGDRGAAGAERSNPSRRVSAAVPWRFISTAARCVPYDGRRPLPRPLGRIFPTPGRHRHKGSGGRGRRAFGQYPGVLRLLKNDASPPWPPALGRSFRPAIALAEQGFPRRTQAPCLAGQKGSGGRPGGGPISTARRQSWPVGPGLKNPGWRKFSAAWPRRGKRRLLRRHPGPGHRRPGQEPSDQPGASRRNRPRRLLASDPGTRLPAPCRPADLRLSAAVFGGSGSAADSRHRRPGCRSGLSAGPGRAADADRTAVLPLCEAGRLAFADRAAFVADRPSEDSRGASRRFLPRRPGSPGRRKKPRHGATRAAARGQ